MRWRSLIAFSVTRRRGSGGRANRRRRHPLSHRVLFDFWWVGDVMYVWIEKIKWRAAVTMTMNGYSAFLQMSQKLRFDWSMKWCGWVQRVSKKNFVLIGRWNDVDGYSAFLKKTFYWSMKIKKSVDSFFLKCHVTFFKWKKFKWKKYYWLIETSCLKFI